MREGIKRKSLESYNKAMKYNGGKTIPDRLEIFDERGNMLIGSFDPVSLEDFEIVDTEGGEKMFCWYSNMQSWNLPFSEFDHYVYNGKAYDKGELPDNS